MKRNPTQKLSPIQKNRLLRAAVLLVILGLAWLLFSPGSGLLALYTAKKELKALQVETEKLAQDNARFQQEIDKMKNNSTYLEEVARRDFGLLKPNERVYDFSKPKKDENE